MSILRVALAQVSWSGVRESMVDALECDVREAAWRGAQLVAFPELCTTPYFCTEPDNAGAFEPIPDGPTTRRMRALAAELGVVLVVPLAERDEHGHQYNSAVVLDADGTVAGTYRKRHLPHGAGSWEQSYFRPGTGTAVFATTVGRIGVAICWDRYFPDVWEKLERDRAQLTIVPIASGRRPDEPADPPITYPHTMFVATVNRVDAPHYRGGSTVVGPAGQVIGSFGSRNPEVAIREIDLTEAY